MTYISSATQQALYARYRLTAMLVGALGASTLLYVAIGWFFAPALPHGDYPWLNNNSIVVMVLVAVVLLIFIRRWLLASTRLESVRGVSGILSAFYLSSLVGAVLGDFVGIVGVVASLLTGVREYSWRLGIAALLMIAYSFPRRTEWERAVARREAEKEQELPPASGNLPNDAVTLGLVDSE